MKNVVLTLVVLAILSFPGAALRAQADGLVCTARGGTAQEIPFPTVSPGTEDTIFVANFTPNGQLSRLKLNVRIFGDTEAAVIAAHIHCGRAGENGLIVLSLERFSTGGGRWDGTATNGDVIPFPPGEACATAVNNIASLVDSMHLGETYVNIHTTINPPGELRGQISCRFTEYQ